MNIEQLYKICKSITKDVEIYKDLAHDTFIKLKDIPDNGTMSLAYITAKNLYIDSKRSKREHNNLNNEVLIEDLQETKVDYFELLEKAKKHLTEIELLWLNTYIDTGSYSAIERKTGISRKASKERIDRIKEICQKLK